MFEIWRWKDAPLPVHVAMLIFLAGLLTMSFANCGDEPDDEEGSAVLCDFLCVYDDTRGNNVCHWYCEDPEFEVACNKCDYFCASGICDWQCTHCDIGTY